MTPSVFPLRPLSAALIAAFSLAGVALVSEVALYQKLVVPELSRLQSVPILWWVGVLSPLVLAMLLLGYFSCSFSSVVASALGGTAGLIGQQFVMAYLNQPGHLKSLAIEGPLYFLSIGSTILFGLVSLVVWAGFATRHFIRHSDMMINSQ